MTKTAKTETKTEKLADLIIEGLKEKKGEHILQLDLHNLHHAVCDQFIVCTGNSSTHVAALADSVDEFVKKHSGEDPWHTEGYQNSEWILLDYVDVVVHIMQPDTRKFFSLEKLWADAVVKPID